MYGVADENFLAITPRAVPSAGAMWLENELAKKFQLGWPLTPYIATKFAEGIPSLNNFKPNPGVKLSNAPYAVFFDISGSLAQENLIKPLAPPV